MERCGSVILRCPCSVCPESTRVAAFRVLRRLVSSRATAAVRRPPVLGLNCGQGRELVLAQRKHTGQELELEAAPDAGLALGDDERRWLDDQRFPCCLQSQGRSGGGWGVGGAPRGLSGSARIEGRDASARAHRGPASSPPRALCCGAAASPGNPRLPHRSWSGVGAALWSARAPGIGGAGAPGRPASPRGGSPDWLAAHGASSPAVRPALS